MSDDDNSIEISVNMFESSDMEFRGINGARAGGLYVRWSLYSISPGHFWRGLDVANLNTLRMIASSGKSTLVANWFKTEAQGGYMLDSSTVATSPTELNFAVNCYVRISLSEYRDLQIENVVLARENVGDSANWWITASSMERHDSTTAKMECQLYDKLRFDKPHIGTAPIYFVSSKKGFNFYV